LGDNSELPLVTRRRWRGEVQGDSGWSEPGVLGGGEMLQGGESSVVYLKESPALLVNIHMD